MQEMMQEITKAVRAFEMDPNDERAQDINLITSRVCVEACVALEHGEPLSPLGAILNKAYQALHRTASPTAITLQYEKNMLRRKKVLQAKRSGDYEAARAVLDEALSEAKTSQ